MNTASRKTGSERWLGILWSISLTLGAWALASGAAADNKRWHKAPEKSVFQKTDVFEFFGETPDGPTPPNPGFTGAAWLKRSADSIQARVMTGVEEAGIAHTIWVVVFNNPENCVDGCNGADAFNPEGGSNAAVYYGTAAISSQTPSGGAVNVDIPIGSDGLPEGIFSLDQAIGADILADGLTPGHGFCSEVHLVVDNHGYLSSPGSTSWVPDLTRTDFPDLSIQTLEILGAGNHRLAVFAPIEGKSCPKPRKGKHKNNHWRW